MTNENIPSEIRLKLEEMIKSGMDLSDVADSEIIITPSANQGATSLKRNGGIYDIHAVFLKSDGTLKESNYRAKKFSDRDRYLRSVFFQDALNQGGSTGVLESSYDIASSKGALVGRSFRDEDRFQAFPDMAFVIDILGKDDANMITLEPLIRAKRLTDCLRDTKEGRDPFCAAEYSGELEKTSHQLIKQAMRTAIMTSDYVTAKVLDAKKDTSSILTSYNSLNHFILPFISQSGVATNQDYFIKKMTEAFRLDGFLEHYDKSRKFIVNKDNHTGNTLVREVPTEEYNYSMILTDLEDMREDILEEPLAEIMVTSGITDDKKIRKILSSVYRHYNPVSNFSKKQRKFNSERYKRGIKYKIDGVETPHTRKIPAKLKLMPNKEEQAYFGGRTFEEFVACFNHKLAEKYLMRTVRYLDMSKRNGGNETEKGFEFYDLACRAYTEALDLMDKNGMKNMKDIVKEFNDKYVGLLRINHLKDPKYGFHNTLCSVANN